MLAGVNCLAGDLILGLFKRSSDFSGRRICEETTKNNNKKMAYEGHCPKFCVNGNRIQL